VTRRAAARYKCAMLARRAASVLVCAALPAFAQHEGHSMASMPPQGEPATLVLPEMRNASGTSWQPDATPMRGVHLSAGGWMVMLHGALSAGYDDQLGNRGGDLILSTNWFMGMAQHPLWGGEVQLRGMISLEALTIPGDGFPLLLQSGESYHGVHLHDRQHPHDFVMEASFTYRHRLSDWLGAELYLAPSGEPALGPPVYMHRASAEGDPFPPISHHWQDSTHISFGVITAGLYSQQVKLEASWFNGREPDDNRWNFDFDTLDSFAVRLSANPVRPVSLQVSYGYLDNPDAASSPPGAKRSVSRVTGSLSVSLPLPMVQIDSTLVWGRNVSFTALDSFLFETNFDLDGVNAPFVRLEAVQKSAHDLDVPGFSGTQAFTQSYLLTSAVLGFVRSFSRLGPLEPALGIRVSVGRVPGDLDVLYGSRAVLGGYVYLLLRPPRL
jgi:hypothetical protein